MGRKIMVRYLILITVLIICAGIAWYASGTTHNRKENAVLALRTTLGRKENIVSASEILRKEDIL